VGLGLRFRGEHLAKAPLRDEAGVRLALELALRKSGAAGLPLEEVRARALGLFRPSRQEGLWRRAGEGLEAVVARFPGAFLRVEVLDAEALVPEWGFRYGPWEVRDAALPLAPGGGVPGREAPLGAVSR
jgi:protein ImuB